VNPFWTIIGVGAPVAAAGTGLLILRQAGWSLAEAAAGGVTIALVILSLLSQAALAVGRPETLGPAAAGLLGLAGLFLCRRRRRAGEQMALAWAFGRSQPLAAAILLSLLAAVATGVAIVPGEPPSSSPSAIPLPDHFTALSQFWVNLGLNAAAGGVLTLVIVAAATYALARRYAWPPIAATVTLVTLSQPRLVRLALVGSPELMSAAAGLFVLMALYRTVEQPRFENLAVLVLGISFEPCRLPLGWAFALVLAALSAVILYRRHGAHLWLAMVRRRPWLSAGVVAGALVVGGIWRVGLPDSSPLYAFNQDAIVGATANLMRYLWESLNPGPGVQVLGELVTGIGPREQLEILYRAVAQPVFGQRGAAAPFDLAAGPQAAGGWLGPLALCLVLPAVGFALVRGPRRLKAVAVALVGYGYLATLIPAWVPGNAALFTRFFVCGGFMTAFLLPPWRLTRVGTTALQCFCFLLVVTTCMHVAGWHR
jgi:hypothetical protein